MRTLGQWNLLDACPVPTGKHLHLTLVLVELSVRPTNRLPIVTAVPVASATLKLLLLQTAKHIVALVRLHKTCRNPPWETDGSCVSVSHYGDGARLTYPLIGWTLHLIASGSITQLPCKRTALANVVEPGGLEGCLTSTQKQRWRSP